MTMTKEQVLQAAKDYIAFVENLSPASERVDPQLVMLADQLALAYHFADFPFDESEYGEPPEKKYEQLRKNVQRNFPELGFYNIPLRIDLETPDSEVTIGDAIDDIVDIALDMKEFVWRWEHFSEQDALWYFRFAYTSHWGMHLRALQLYLYAKQM